MEVMILLPLACRVLDSRRVPTHPMLCFLSHCCSVLCFQHRPLFSAYSAAQNLVSSFSPHLKPRSSRATRFFLDGGYLILSVLRQVGQEGFLCSTAKALFLELSTGSSFCQMGSSLAVSGEEGRRTILGQFDTGSPAIRRSG